MLNIIYLTLEKRTNSDLNYYERGICINKNGIRIMCWKPNSFFFLRCVCFRIVPFFCASENPEVMELTRIKAHQMSHSANGLLFYRYSNKSRRKSPMLLMLTIILLMPLTCDGEEKIIRVDPLGSIKEAYWAVEPYWTFYLSFFMNYSMKATENRFHFTNCRH